VRRWAWFVGGLLLAALTWTWLQGAQVPSGEIQSTDYDPGVTAIGTKVLNDLQALETAVNNVDSSQIGELSLPGTKFFNNTIDYLKLQYRDLDVAGVSWAFEDDALDDTTAYRIFTRDVFADSLVDTLFASGVLQTTESGSQKVAWGCVTVGDTAVDANDSCWVTVPFEDSTDVGNPNFRSSPRYFLTVNYTAGTIKRKPLVFMPVVLDSTQVAGWLVNVAASTGDSLTGWFEVFWQAVE